MMDFSTPQISSVDNEQAMALEEGADDYLVAIVNNGASGKKIGCDDSLVPVPTTLPAAPDPITGALEALFSIPDQHYCQLLYNFPR